MPKAMAKSKHGWRASATDQGKSDNLSAIPPLAQEASKEPSPALHSARSHHKLHGHRVSSSKAEKRRDKVLTKLCAKASANLSAASPAPVPRTTEAPVVVSRPTTPDQLSLQDCPVTVSTTDLWGSGSPTPEPASQPDHPPESAPQPDPSASISSTLPVAVTTSSGAN